MDLEKRVEDKDYYKYVTKEGISWGKQYYELNRIYKEIIDESLDWIIDSFTDGKLITENLNNEGRALFFEADMKMIKKMLQKHLIFHNIDILFRTNKIGMLVEYKEKNVEIDEARD